MPYITDTTPVYFIFTFAAFKLLESRNTTESVYATFLFLFGWWPEEVWSIWSYQNNMINKKKDLVSPKVSYFSDGRHKPSLIWLYSTYWRKCTTTICLIISCGLVSMVILTKGSLEKPWLLNTLCNSGIYLIIALVQTLVHYMLSQVTMQIGNTGVVLFLFVCPRGSRGNGSRIQLWCAYPRMLTCLAESFS